MHLLESVNDPTGPDIGDSHPHHPEIRIGEHPEVY
jgi:hypothetical protein